MQPYTVMRQRMKSGPRGRIIPTPPKRVHFFCGECQPLITASPSTTTVLIKRCDKRNTVGLHFLQAFHLLWPVYRKNIYRIQKAYTSLSNRIYHTVQYFRLWFDQHISRCTPIAPPRPNVINHLSPIHLGRANSWFTSSQRCQELCRLAIFAI